MKQEEEKKLIKDEAIQQFEFLLEYFNRHIPLSADLEYTSLRAHLLAEYYLNHLLILKLGSDKFDEIENLGFHAKVHRLRALKIEDLKNWVVSSLFKLNKIRNNLSHSLEYKINEADVDSLGFYFGKEYIYRKFSKGKSDLKTNFRWILIQIIAELYRPIATEMVMESIRKKKQLDSKTAMTETRPLSKNEES